MKGAKYRASGTMTDAQLKAKIIASLRRMSMHWKPISTKRNSLRTGEKMEGPRGRRVFAHKCESCGDLFPAKEIKVDHKEPVVPTDGWGDTTSFLGINWNEYLKRLFVEEDGLSGICYECHSGKTAGENSIRSPRQHRSSPRAK